MIIDITGIATNNVKDITIDGSVNIDNSLYNDTTIRDLSDVKFVGKVNKIDSGDYQLIGILSGVMILPDDITMEDVDYSFKIDIDEIIPYNGNDFIKIIQNKLDITEFLWQNILVEVPSKVKNPKNEGLTMEGNGWRLITEDELDSGNNSPFSELSKMFDSRKE